MALKMGTNKSFGATGALRSNNPKSRFIHVPLRKMRDFSTSRILQKGRRSNLKDSGMEVLFINPSVS